MLYSWRALSAVWIIILGVFALIASGTVTGTGRWLTVAAASRCRPSSWPSMNDAERPPSAVSRSGGPCARGAHQRAAERLDPGSAGRSPAGRDRRPASRAEGDVPVRGLAICRRMV